MVTKTNPDPLKAFMELLVKMGILSKPQAEVYGIIVDKGKTTAKIIGEQLRYSATSGKVTKSTVHNYLDELKSKGFIKSTITSGKRKHSTCYKANSPVDALKPYFADTNLLKNLTDDVVTQLEIIKPNEEDNLEQDIWLYEPKRVAVRAGISLLEKANESIIICCNDYTWIHEAAIEEVILKKLQEDVDIRILGEQPLPGIRSTLKKFNSIRKETEIPCIPHCLIDGRQLLIFFFDGLEHRLLATKNTYMVSHYSAQFEKIWKEFSNEV